ncbi:MAG: histidine kinase [Bacteroidota bacterium]
MNFLKHPKNHLKRLVNILGHPTFLSLVSTLIIFLIFPIHSTKYRLELQQIRKLYNDNRILWEDLEGDSISDLISTSNNDVGTAGVTVVLNPSGHVEQWNFRGQFSFKDDNFISTGDYNMDGKKEVYAFTLSNDSIYLSYISDFYHLKLAFINRFISTVELVNGETDVNFGPVQMADLNHDGYKELIFCIKAGFSIYPRAIFTYDVKNDKLLKSPELGFYPFSLILADFNGDGNLEIVPAGYAPENITDRIVQFHDSSSWVIMLNSKLQYIFPPKEFTGRLGGLAPVAFPSRVNHSTLTVLRNKPPDSNAGYVLFQINLAGEIIRQKQLTELNPEMLVLQPYVMTQGKSEILMLQSGDGSIYGYDSLFNCIQKSTINQSISDRLFMDIDNDNQIEVITQNDVLNQITVFRHDFNDPVSFSGIKLAEPRQTRISLVRGIHGENKLFIISGDMAYTLVYGENSILYSKWIFYLAGFTCILLFTFLVRKLQRNQLQKKYQTEKKITELQLKIVRNQMDPHFTMNAINAVVDAINREEKEQARENLLHFSQMYRSLVLSADKIKRTLQEELDFTENYLALERFRFGNRFTYHLRIHPEVDTRWEVPKMVIQSPVENAVKHGLLNKETGGEINIQARVEDHKLILEITDNGVGRTASAVAGKISTGKGMEMMEQFFALYYKITGVKVQSNVSDLTDESGNPIGTRVVVMISLP